MNFTKKQRFEIIIKLSRTILDMGKQNGVLFLEEYTKSEVELTDRYNNQSFSYDTILKFIQFLDNTTIFEMYKDVFPEKAKKEFPKRKVSYQLSTEKLVLFFSHSHKNIKLVSNVQTILEKTAWIKCFIAHKDIKPTEKWKEEIKKYLECCHCLVAFLSQDFKSSDYCDQELGFVLNRDIPIFSVKLDHTNPYGFIYDDHTMVFSKNGKTEKLAFEIEGWLLDEKRNPAIYNISKSKLKNAVELLKNNFLNSTNTQMAKSVLDQLMAFKKGQIDSNSMNEIQNHWQKNSKIKEVQNIEEKIKKFFKSHEKKK